MIFDFMVNIRNKSDYYLGRYWAWTFKCEY